MKKSTKFLLALGSISSLVTLPLIAAKCNKTEEKKDDSTNKTDNTGNKTDGSSENTTETSDVNSIVKDLKDILVLVKSEQVKKVLEEFKKDSKSYSLWYDRKSKNIVITKGNHAPFGRNFSGEKWDLFELNDKGSKIDGNFQLVNDEKPIFKENKLSGQLNFTFDSNTQNITIKYKVGEFKGKDNTPEVSEKANESTISLKD
ncbi:Hypothetical protein, predicted lipoprotein [Metamycoplasma auris 15026]|uniref:Variable surface lipoprotein n=1 Tax=Metamycoplasma auris 15026 TaxID=1188233 RepID=N9VCT1_9BACT|nr:variable surface lipoprotein [Metamycoplasma auris]ENY69186.1 Hypothetical protein, predicted lipoprotein [Metamycoplasma auris 15026]